MSKVMTKEMSLQDEWFKDAKEQTLETLPEFISHVMNDYNHDYETVVHAISACAIAAAWAANREKGAWGGITGFQAGFVMWDFVRQWMYSNNKTGFRLLDYDDLLYPQYADKFEKTITPSIWEHVQKEAKARIEETQFKVRPDVMAHWQSIADGKPPFGFTVK